MYMYVVLLLRNACLSEESCKFQASSNHIFYPYYIVFMYMLIWLDRFIVRGRRNMKFPDHFEIFGSLASHIIIDFAH